MCVNFATDAGSFAIAADANGTVATATIVLAIVAGFALVANLWLAYEARSTGRTALNAVDQQRRQTDTLKQLVDEIVRTNDEARKRARAIIRGGEGFPTRSPDACEGDVHYVGGTDLALDVNVSVRFGDIYYHAGVGDLRPTESRRYRANVADPRTADSFPPQGDDRRLLRAEAGTGAVLVWWKATDGAQCWWCREFLLVDQRPLGSFKEGAILRRRPGDNTST